MRKGLTMIEILLALGLLAVLMSVGIMLMDPAAQFANARNSQRELHLTSILNGIRQNMADTSGGAFTCATGPIPSSTTRMASGPGNYDIAPCLLPIYLPVLPYDPSLAGARFVSSSDYDTGYDIIRNASTGIITVSAPGAELGRTVSVTR